MKRQKKLKSLQKAAERRGAFDVDMNNVDKKPMQKKAKEKQQNGEFVFKEKITELRKNGKKSVNSFKSKTRYNRRK